MWKMSLVMVLSILLVVAIGRPDRVSCARIVEDDYFMDGPPLYMSEERMSEGRDILILNGLWQFMPVEGGVDAPGAFEHLPDVESDKWLDIFVPMELPDSFFAECGVHRGWFRKVFEVEEDRLGDITTVTFNAIRFFAEVYLNGHKVGDRRLVGWTPYEVDLTPYLQAGKNELLVAVTDKIDVYRKGDAVSDWSADVAWNSHDYRTCSLLAPTAYYYSHSAGGIIEDVYATFYPRVYISDLFIQPSVRQNKLKIKLSVSNTTDEEKEVVLKNKAVGREGEEQVFPDTQLSIGAGEVKEIELSFDWEDARYWVPHAPYLYYLYTEIDVDGVDNDLKKTRFGFREVWIDGSEIYLNGRVLRIREGSMMPHAGRREEGSVKALIRELLREGRNTLRPHLIPGPSIWSEIADEMGMLIVYESGVHFKGWAFADEIFWDNYRDHMMGLFERNKNNPSVIMWSLENEVISWGNHHSFPNLLNDLYELEQMMKTVDPTRLVDCHAAKGLTGGEIINLHYPLELTETGWQYGFLPLKTRWIWEDIDGQGLFKWDRDRPLIIGECATARSSPVSSYFGDRLYETEYENTNIEVAKLWIESYRYAGVSGIDPWIFGGKLADVLSPVYVMVYEYDLSMTAGEENTRTLVVFNDILEDKEYILSWSVQMDGALVSEGSERLSMQAGEKSETETAIQLPEVGGRTTALLQYKLIGKNGENVFEGEKEYSVLARTGFSSLRDKVVDVYDATGCIQDAFRRVGLEYRDVVQIDSLDASSKVLVVGGSTDLSDRQMREYVQQGGTVLAFNIEKDFAAGGVNIKVDIAHEAPRGFIKNVSHPILKNISDSDIFAWGDDCVVVTNGVLKPTKGNYSILIDAGGFVIDNAGTRDGMDWAGLIEVFDGHGSYIISQMSIIENIGKVTAADRLLENILKYGYSAKERIPSVTGLLSEKKSSAESVIKDISLAYQRIDIEDLSDQQIVILDGGLEYLSGLDKAKLKEFVDSGGTLVIWGIGEDTLQWYNELLPVQVGLKHQNISRVKVMQNDSVMAGISSYDLYWLKGESVSTEEVLLGISRESQTVSAMMHPITITGGHTEQVTVLTEPALIVQISSGKGSFVINQIAWDKVIGAEKDRTTRVVLSMFQNSGGIFHQGTWYAGSSTKIAAALLLAGGIGGTVARRKRH